MTAGAIARDASRQQTPTGRATRPVPAHVRMVLEMANRATDYLRRVAPQESLTSRGTHAYIGHVIGADWSRGTGEGLSDAGGLLLERVFDVGASYFLEQRFDGTVIGFALAGGGAIAFRRGAREWTWHPAHCARCDRHLLGGLAETLHAPYCSRVCGSGRVPARLLTKMLAYLNGRWARRLELIKLSEPDIEQQPDDPTSWAHGNSDKLSEHPRMIAFNGVDWPATERRQAEIGEAIGVFVLVDGREVRKVGVKPWEVFDAPPEGGA